MINIKVVGGGCPNCQKLENLCREVVSENDIQAEIEKVSDVNRFAEMGIFMTPGLLINNKVVSSGKIPVKSTLKQWIKSAAQ
ncbi:MAG: thioredoxin family protein [Caldithrix sp.]|nr:thioredoxin family protein [Caldithrix sp.]